MRAAVLHECPGWLDITDLHVGVIGPHEVLVQTQAAGLCHSDLHCIEGTLPIPVPSVLGHESSGVVEAVGSEVTDFRPGDEVIACTSAACGLCAMCTTGRPNMCQDRPSRAAGLGPALSENGEPVDQFAGIGGFAEQMLLPEQALLKIDEAGSGRGGRTRGLRRDHRPRRGVQHREGSARRDGRGDRLRRHRAQRGAGRGGRRCGAGDRRRRRLREARACPHVRRNRRRRRDGRRSRRAGDASSRAVASSTRSKRSGARPRASRRSRCSAPGGTATIIGVSPFGTMVELPGLDFMRRRRSRGRSWDRTGSGSTCPTTSTSIARAASSSTS